MAAAQNTADGKGSARRTPMFTKVIVALNILGPLAIGALMAWGAEHVAESRRQVEQAQEQLSAKSAEIRVVQQDLDDAKAKKKDLEKSSEALEKNNTKLLAQKESLEQSIDELLESKKVILDPEAEVERVRRQVGGKNEVMRADAFYKAGRDAYARGDKSLAERFYEESRKELEDYAPTRIGFGRLQADRGNYLEAEAQYLRAAKADPRNAHATFNIAFVNMLLKKYSKAEEYASKTMAIDPKYERVEELRKEIARRKATDNKKP